MRDLFGEIPVTLDDVLAWCAAVPRIAADSPRLARYVTAYNVVAKIQRAKLEGSFQELTAPAPMPAPARLLAALATSAGTRSPMSTPWRSRSAR